MRAISSSVFLLKLAVVALALGPWVVSANLLTNPGFETGDFSGWTLGGTSTQTQVNDDGVLIPGIHISFDPTFQNVHSGKFAANALVRTFPLEILTLEQSVAVQGNTTYDVGYFVNVDSRNPRYGFQSNGSNWNAIFHNGSPLLLMGIMNNIGPGDGTGPDASDFREVSASFTTALNQAIATITFQITGSGTRRAGFSVDDFYLRPAVIPVPAAVWLFGTALLGLIGLSRRSKVA